MLWKFHKPFWDLTKFLTTEAIEEILNFILVLETF